MIMLRSRSRSVFHRDAFVRPCRISIEICSQNFITLLRKLRSMRSTCEEKEDIITQNRLSFLGGRMVKGVRTMKYALWRMLTRVGKVPASVTSSKPQSGNKIRLATRTLASHTPSLECGFKICREQHHNQGAARRQHEIFLRGKHLQQLPAS